MRSSGCSAKNSLSGSEGSADFRLSVHYSSTILALSRHYLEAEVGIALHHCSVPILTTPMQINQLRSFPSKIRLPEAFEKIKNYPANSVSKFSHLFFQYHFTGAFTGGCSGFVEISPGHKHYPCPERSSPRQPHSPRPTANQKTSISGRKSAEFACQAMSFPTVLPLSFDYLFTLYC